MKINDRNDLAALDAARQSQAIQSEGSGKARSRLTDRGGEDRAEVSGLSAQLSQAIQGTSPERVARIDALKSEIAAGRYKPDAASTTRGLVREALADAARAGGE